MLTEHGGVVFRGFGVGGQELIETIPVRVRQVAVAQGGDEAFEFAAQVRAHGGAHDPYPARLNSHVRQLPGDVGRHGENESRPLGSCDRHPTVEPTAAAD